MPPVCASEHSARRAAGELDVAPEQRAAAGAAHEAGGVVHQLLTLLDGGRDQREPEGDDQPHLEMYRKSLEIMGRSPAVVS